jgi:16S rRNA (guanine527-N7)-methyltransferase
MERKRMTYHVENFIEGLSNLNIELSEEQLNQFIRYYEMLIEKNKVMNLTAITEFEDVIEKHFLDSLSLAKEIDLTKNLTVLDMGTGAGFPGIPLKIAFPNLHITLADSLNKRILFLQEVINQLELDNISALHYRAEEMAAKKIFREQFDLVISRAVANLSTLAEYCLPFARVGGQFVSYKSGECDQEVNDAAHAIQILGGELSSVSKFTLGDAGRAFVMIQKVKPTPKTYPRKAGTPSKNPL